MLAIPSKLLSKKKRNPQVFGLRLCMIFYSNEPVTHFVQICSVNLIHEEISGRLTN